MLTILWWANLRHVWCRIGRVLLCVCVCVCVCVQVNAITGGLFTSDVLEAAAKSKEVSLSTSHNDTVDTSHWTRRLATTQ